MKPRCRAAGVLLPGLFGLLFNGCATTHEAPTATRDHAFIQYWPPPENSRPLRLAVKDLIDMKGVVTTAGCEFLAKTSQPADRDAKCLEIARRRKDVHIIGKTNTSELAVAASGINPYFGTPKNPMSRARNLIPGGSSSGSAVAVANNEADVAFGTDTAGSVRMPAACCGIVGLKTTFGLIPLDGVYPIAPNQLDTVGPMGRDVAHVVRGMDLLQEGFAAKYRAVASASPPAQRIRIGRLYLSGTDRKVDQAVDDALARAGFEVVPMSANFKEKWEQAEKDAATVAAAYAWLYDQKFRKESGVTLKTKLIVAVGESQYKSNLRDALKRRAAWQAELSQALTQVDFIALPTIQKLPPSMPLFGGTIAFEARVLGLQNTEAVNLAGNPAVALPVPMRAKVIPFTSLQLIGRKRSEAELLNAARIVEAANPPR